MADHSRQINAENRALHTRSMGDGGGALDEVRPEQGSYYWYRQHGGGFVNKFLDAVAQADQGNRQRLKLSFPQMVSAWELWYNNNDRDGNCAPEGFVPDPFAKRDPDLLMAAKDLGHICSHCDWWHAQSCTHWEARDECFDNCKAARAAISTALG